MKNYIKDKKVVTTMRGLKFIFSTLLILLLSSLSVNSAIYEFGIQANINYKEASILGFSNPTLVLAGVGETNNFELTTTPLYVIMSAPGNSSINVNITYEDSVLNEFITTQLYVPKNGIQLFEISPQFIGDQTTMIFTDSTGDLFYSYIFVNDDFRKGDSITETFVGAMKDLIDINIGIWKLVYYLFIIALIFMGIGILIAFSFKVYEWAEDLSHKKKDMIERTGLNKNNKRRE